MQKMYMCRSAMFGESTVNMPGVPLQVFTVNFTFLLIQSIVFLTRLIHYRKVQIIHTGETGNKMLCVKMEKATNLRDN